MHMKYHKPNKQFEFIEKDRNGNLKFFGVAGYGQNMNWISELLYKLEVDYESDPQHPVIVARYV